MRQTFLAAALAVAACAGFTTPAAGQPDPPPVATPDPPPIVQRVTDLERRVAALEKAKAATPCGCPLADCTCGAKCPCPAPSALPTRAAAGHTHTCARGHTWDHTMDGGSHRCPVCGLTQFVQDSEPRAVNSTPLTGGSSYAGSGCANGACAVQYAPARSGFRLFRR